MGDKYTKTDWSGGVRSDLASAIDPDESTVLTNFYCHNKNLRAMEGSIPWSTQAPEHWGAVASNAQPAFVNLFEYSTASVSYLIAKAPRKLWVGIHSQMTVSSTSGQLVTFTAATYDDQIPQSGWFLFTDVVYAYTAKHDTNRTITVTQSVAAFSAGDVVDIVSWRPLIGDTTANASHYLEDSDLLKMASGEWISARVSMEQVNNDLFVAYNDFDTTDTTAETKHKLYRWGGFLFCKGQVSSNGTTAVTAGTYTGATAPAWSTNGVLPGDTLFINTGTPTYGVLDGYVISVVTDSTLTLVDAPGTAFSNCDYVIVRTHPAGIPAAGTCTATAGSSGGTIDAGNWQFKYRFYDTAKSEGGNISASSATVSFSADEKITVSGWNSDTQQFNANKVEIYARFGVGSPITWNQWRHITAEDITRGAGLAFADTIVISTLTHTDGTETDISDYDVLNPPGYITGLKWFDNRLWARGMFGNRHKLYMSTYGQSQQWPDIDWDTDDTEGFDPLLGGCVQLGKHSGDPITGIVAEGGTYSTTGNVGSNLLVFLQDRAIRWYGLDWTDYVYREALGVGCIADDSIENKDGRIYWVSEQGPMCISSGANEPQRCGIQIWPYGLSDEVRDLRAPELPQFLPWQSATWNQFYALAAQDPTTHTYVVYLLDTETGGWTIHSTECRGLATSADGTLYGGLKTNTVACKLMAGSWVADGPRVYATRIVEHSDTLPGYTVVSMPLKVTTGPLYLGSLDRKKAGYKVTAAVRRTTGDQAITLKVYTDGSPTASYTGAAQTVTAYTPGSLSTVNCCSTERQYVSWNITKPRGACFQLELSSTATYPFIIDWLAMDAELSSHVSQG